MSMDTRIEGLKNRLRNRSDFQAATSLVRQGESVVLSGLTGGGYAFLSAVLSEIIPSMTLIVTSKPGEAERLAAELPLFTEQSIDTYPLLPDSLIETDDAYFYREDIDFGHRLRLLKELLLFRARPQNKSGKRIIVASLPAIMQKVPSAEEMKRHSLVLSMGQTRSPESIVHELIDFGFQSMTAVELPGEYSRRGDILDIFSADSSHPVRIEFFGDDIESIRFFDVTDQCSLETVEKVDISGLRRKSGVSGSFLDYLPGGTVIHFIETDQIVQEAQKLVQFGHVSGIVSDSDDENRTSSRLVVADVMNSLYRFPVVHAVSFSGGTEVASARWRFDMRSTDRFSGSLQQLLGKGSLTPFADGVSRTVTTNQSASAEQGDYRESNEATQRAKVFPEGLREPTSYLTDGTELMVVCQTETEATRMDSVLRQTALGQQGKLTCVVGFIHEGFDWEDEKAIVLPAAQLFGRPSPRPVKKRVLGKKIDSFLDLSPGDLVIHISYGVARFLGLETIKKTQVEEEHLKLEFADQVVVYVPVSRIQLIQKYVGAGKSAPKLAKINSTVWSKQKKTVQTAVLNLAMEMIDLQARRSTLTGTKYPVDSDWQMEFEGLFPWQETTDQLLAIADVKRDMEHSRPMDRLLCGDVGFGKTEVALRAAFKAADAGYQVAILVPTTVLAEQHYRVFKERLLTFPVTVDVLSRFTPMDRRRVIRQSLQDGTLDIVVGTNALTRSDISFRNLGLIIIDEEQKFGVQDKEKLKQLRQMTDVLTMTATPIPRTLHFSLLGLRDISNLETPPENRLPVETRVMRFDSDFIRRAIMRELNRQGQVYFVHNRVFDIEEIVWKLKQIVPEARIGVGHAQMSDDKLETVMRDFILQKYDVLVCTTIIESGLDIPNANTIFIDRADRFGLAELHQLRGRVGRDRFQAYCYLLLEPNQVLAPDAARRLKAIEEYSHLGSGFNIAMRDLEIRGAGNILGTQQSGHIAMVGYEMYCDFLEDAVRVLKQMPQKTVIDVEVDLPGTALIPRSYIADQHTKIDVYRRLLRITTLEEYYLIQQELRDRFGPEPPEVRRLLLHAHIRVNAFQHRIYSLQLTSEGDMRFLTMKFHAENYMRQLHDNLKIKKIDLRMTDDLMGHVPIPKELVDSSGNLKENELADFIVDLLRQPLNRTARD